MQVDKAAFDGQKGGANRTCVNCTDNGQQERHDIGGG
jgi:hypothetical protein